MAVGVGQHSQLVFPSGVCYAIVLNVLLGNVLTTEARSVAVVGDESEQSRDQDTCMTHWLRHATVNATSSVTAKEYEKLILGLLLSDSTSSGLSDLQPNFVVAALGGNKQAADYLLRCTSSSRSSFECARDSPCLNGGQCVFRTTTSMSRDFKCQCADGYTGRFCATEIPRCHENVCGSGATCTPISSGYVCLCPPLRAGRHCQITWLSQQSFSNVVSSIHQVANRQSELQNYVKNAVNGSAAQVAHFLKKLESKVEASLESRFSSLRSTMEQTQRQSFEKFQLSVSRDQQTASASIRQDISSLQSSVAGMNSKTLEQLLALNSTVQRHLLSDTSSAKSHQHATRPLPQTTSASTTPTTTRPSVSSGSLFDPMKKGVRISLTNNGRTAAVSTFRWGVVLSRSGYTTGRYQWKLLVSRIDKLVIIGVTTLPYRYSDYNGYGSTTTYSWSNDQRNLGLAASQTHSTAALSRWQSGDRLTLTLDCDQQLLTMRLHRTNEEKTIRMDRHGQPLYLHVYVNNSQVQIL